MTVEFKAWPKIQRLNKNHITITEKVDGTNACVIIQDGKVVGAQSRNRLITPDNDNMGFAGWVDQNKDTLKTLGDGYHYGEWAGPGIQKNPHCLDGKAFFLFNTFRWNKVFQEDPQHPARDVVSLVPELYVGPYTEDIIDYTITSLQNGEIGLGAGKPTNPEGIMVYFHAFGQYLKLHIEGRK